MSTRLTSQDAADLVGRAAGGDRRAWERLVDSYVGLIWAITRGYRLSTGDAYDVSQTTWLRLVENIDRLADPGSVGAWLATTARRECLQLLRQSRRTVLVEDWSDLDDADVEAEELDAQLLRHEVSSVVQGALQQLSPASQALMGLLMLEPPPSYEEISAALDMPIGSIGPTRGRCLRKLATLVERPGITENGSAVYNV